MYIYVVEDSQLVLDQLLQAIAGVEEGVIAGSSGMAEAAIEEIRQLNPDLVILDLQLAQGSGWDVLNALKSDGHAAKVIILTNHAGYPFRAQSERLGADYFFDKANEFDRLLETVRKLSAAT